MRIYPVQTVNNIEEGNGGGVKSALSNERGLTLLEVMVTAIVIVLTIISIYIGVVYAEKQMQRNYHDRVATLHASGRMEGLFLYYARAGTFQTTYPPQPVVLDNFPKNKKLYGTSTVSVVATTEPAANVPLPFFRVQVKVSWFEPGDKKTRSVIIVEDFY